MQRVFERRDSGTVEVARIEGETVTGQEAANVEKLLRENGWPGKPAHWVLFGDYLWAERPPKGVTNGN